MDVSQGDDADYACRERTVLGAFGVSKPSSVDMGSFD